MASDPSPNDTVYELLKKYLLGQSSVASHTAFSAGFSAGFA